MSVSGNEQQSLILSRLISQENLSLIPVDLTSKRALVKWADQPRLSPTDLWDKLDFFGTSAVAIVCGKPSEGLVNIDIDTKYKPGFDATFFRDMQELFPELWSRLRRERTPSGGCHIYYKIEDYENQTIPGCFNAASRPSTEDELLADKKRKTRCFLEIKCNGGLSHCYPTPGYQLIHDVSIPVLTWEEHSAIVSMCISYDETPIIAKPIKAPTEDSEYYSENPYEHFNRSSEGAEILKQAGWNYVRTRGKYVYYSKPDKKNKKEVSASFNTEKCLYKIFTVATDLDSKAYSPSNLLCETMFNDDKKALYRYLVAKGYGILKPKVEERIVKQRAQFGGDLPANVSEEGKRIYNEEIEKQNTIYPHGIFWEAKDDGFTISREGLYRVSEQLGFRLHGADICKIEGYTIRKVEEREFFDEVKDYISILDEDRYEDICNAYEAFLQKSGKFTVSRLPVMDESILLKSTKDISYKEYNNGVLRISKDDASLLDYNMLDKLVWKNNIQDRDFEFGDFRQGLYYRFLSLALGFSMAEFREKHAMECVGYYAHDYKSPMNAYIVVLCEMTEDSKKGGGAGKNIFTNLFKYTSSVCNKPGDNVKFDDTLLRTWKGEKIFSINDAPKKFNYLGLKELASGQGEVGKKYVQETTIATRDMPKFMCNTNHAFDPSGPGLKRRMIPLEFTDFFTVAGGVDVFFKKDFPYEHGELHDWTQEDWIGFDNFIVTAIQAYMKNNCKLDVPTLTDGGWIKQFEEKYFQLTHQFIKENIDGWCELTQVKAPDFLNQYERFCRENNINRNYILSMPRLNEALQAYCDFNKIEFNKQKAVKEGGIPYYVKVFIRKDSLNKPQIDEDVPF
jgi:hypothetical protein